MNSTVREKMIYEGLPIRFDVREREQKARSERGKIVEGESANAEEAVAPRPRPLKERNPGSHRPTRKAPTARVRPKRKAPGKGKTKKGKKIVRGRSS